MRGEESDPSNWQKPFPATFIWTNLENGQVGFPTGFSIIDVLPGGLMHLAAAACLVQNNYAEEKQFCTGKFEQNNHTFNCPMSHGEVDVVSALSLDCKIFFAKAASYLPSKEFLSSNKLFGTAENFGLTSKVSDFPAGVCSSADKFDQESSSLLATGMSSILRPSPLQLLRLSAYIAKNGILPKLHSADKPVIGAEPEPINVKDSTWLTLQSGMLASAKEGVCRLLDSDNQMNLSAIGSTVKHGERYASWLLGFFPSEKPRNAFIALNESEKATENAFQLAQVYLSANWL